MEQRFSMMMLQTHSFRKHIPMLMMKWIRDRFPAKVEVVQLEKGKPFIFTAEVAVKPEVTLGEYKGLEVDKVSNRVTAKEVEEEIKKNRKRMQEQLK